jgi:hypothetical protein
MNKFYMVCAWDNYYPRSGIGNIFSVTCSEEEAYKLKDDLINKGVPLQGHPNDFRVHRANVEVYSSDELPWVENDV